VRPGFDVPVNAILVIFIFAALISLINIGSTVAFNIVTSLGTGTLTLSYIICISCVIWRKLFDKPLLPTRFDMGKSFGLLVNLIAVVWLCLVLVIAFFPGVPAPLLTLLYANWSVVVWAGVILFSIAYFVLWARKRYVGPVEYVRILD
jgi:amino acid transporter